MGVARQYCGRLGKMANCQAGMLLAYVSPLGRSLVDKRLYLPESWTSDPGRCAAAGVPEERRSYWSKTELVLELLERALGLGHLRAKWVAGDEVFGMSPSFREALAALGCATCWTFRAAHRSGPWSWPGPVQNIRSSGALANPSSGTGSAGPGDASGEEGESIPLWDEAAHRGWIQRRVWCTASAPHRPTCMT